MQIVIDIPEVFYETLSKADMIVSGRGSGKTFMSVIYSAIANGIPLPKGCGDLIDKGKFKKWIETQDGDKLMTEYYLDALDMQETIVGGSHDGDSD